MARVISLAELPDRGGAEYAQGLRAAVKAAVAYALEGMAQGEHEGTPVPEALLVQARRAARSGVGLDTVLRRYVAGHGLLSDFLVQEVDGRLAPAELNRLFRRLAATLDCLLSAVTTAYRLEEQRGRRTSEQRRADLVERLLAGEPLDTADLGYGLEGHHLGLVASGFAATGETFGTLARAMDARSLVINREDESTWVWLGTRKELDPAEVSGLAATVLPDRTALAIGEPGEGPAGWRLTHRQAHTAFSLVRYRAGPLVRYSDIALIATVLQDDLLVTSLRRLYLEPLEAERDGGAALRTTLDAYFSADRNISSAAAALGVDRRTVSNRIRTIEDHLGKSLEACETDLQIALQLHLIS